jgi:hypothetical protein
VTRENHEKLSLDSRCSRWVSLEWKFDGYVCTVLFGLAQGGSIPGRGTEGTVFLCHSFQTGGHYEPYPSGTGSTFSPELNLITHLHLMPRLRMYGALPPRPPTMSLKVSGLSRQRHQQQHQLTLVEKEHKVLWRQNSLD